MPALNSVFIILGNSAELIDELGRAVVLKVVISFIVLLPHSFENSSEACN